MSSLSIIECCQLLAIDAKTLRQWLTQAQMSLHVHPTDARLRCLTDEQVHVLARLHSRALQPLVSSAESILKPEEATSQMLAPALADSDLRVRLAQVEAQVATLQAQLTDLALQLLQERQYLTDARVTRLQAQSFSTDEHALPAPGKPCQPAMPVLVCHPTEQRS